PDGPGPRVPWRHAGPPGSAPPRPTRAPSPRFVGSTTRQTSPAWASARAGTPGSTEIFHERRAPWRGATDWPPEGRVPMGLGAWTTRFVAGRLVPPTLRWQRG